MANRYWVGGTGNWDASDTTHWSATSGGSGGASVPGAADAVIFDANSGGGVVTVTANQNVLSITGGAHTGTVDFGTGLTITVGTGGFSWSGTGTRTLTLGNALINISMDNGSAFTIATATNLTITSNTAVVTLSGNNGGINCAHNLNLNGMSVVMTGNSQQDISGSGTLTMANFTRTGAATKTSITNVTCNLTCTGTFTVNSNSAINRIRIKSSIPGTARIITAATVVTQYTNFQDITGAGAADWDLTHQATNLHGDCGGNTNITFTTPETQTSTGTASFTWSTHGWTTRVPLPQDDVIVNNAFVAGRTITADMYILGKNIDFSGCTGSPIFATSGSAYGQRVQGSLTFAAGMTTSGNTLFTFAGRQNSTLTSAGLALGGTGGIAIEKPGFTLTLKDDLSISGTLNPVYGSLDASDSGANHAVTALNFNASNSATKTITMGTGIWTLTGTGNVWNIASTGVTIVGSNSNIVLSAVSATLRTFISGSQTYGNLSYIVSGSTGGLDFTGSPSFNSINVYDASNARTIRFTAGTTTTIRSLNGFNVYGSTGKKITVTSITGAQHILSSTYAQTCDYLDLSYSNAQGGGLWTPGANSTNSGNNSGWFDPVGGYRIFGDEGMVS